MLGRQLGLLVLSLLILVLLGSAAGLTFNTWLAILLGGVAVVGVTVIVMLRSRGDL